MSSLIGYKVGMTRIFSKEGVSIPVTIIKIEENRVTQIKYLATDGYNAVQVTTGIKKNNHLNKASIGHFTKAKVEPGYGLWELNINTQNKNIKIGTKLTLNIFTSIKKVDIVGVSKGKGFAGTVKRWNFHTQDATHGNSLSHRAPGSIGQNQTPGRVFKGKKMAGHMGHNRVTIQNLDIINIDLALNLLIVKGAVPGVINSTLIIKKSVKNLITEEIKN